MQPARIRDPLGGCVPDFLLHILSFRPKCHSSHAPSPREPRFQSRHPCVLSHVHSPLHPCPRPSAACAVSLRLGCRKGRCRRLRLWERRLPSPGAFRLEEPSLVTPLTAETPLAEQSVQTAVLGAIQPLAGFMCSHGQRVHRRASPPLGIPRVPGPGRHHVWNPCCQPDTARRRETCGRLVLSGRTHFREGQVICSAFGLTRSPLLALPLEEVPVPLEAALGSPEAGPPTYSVAKSGLLLSRSCWDGSRCR